MSNYITKTYIYILCWLSIPNLIIFFLINIDNSNCQMYIRDIHNILTSYFPDIT